MEIQRGFRDKLEKYLNPDDLIQIDMAVSGNAVYDFTCFGLDANEKLSDDRYMIFYNQTNSPDSEINFLSYNNGAKFNINLSRLPKIINKLAFTVSIDGTGTMSEIDSHRAAINFHNEPVITMNLKGSDFHEERAIISIEIYRKDSTWRFAAVANGFKGGLSELLKFYGGDEVKDNKPVELRKGQKVKLEKKSQSMGEISVNLNWHAGKKSKLFSSKNSAIDLDLGCLYELKDGSKGAIQALGENFGSLDDAPYIALDFDDRTGASEDGETLKINGAKISEIKRVLIYTFIYDGILNWREADGVVTVKCPGSRDIIVKLDEYDITKGMCAIVMLENMNDETFSVEKLVKFFGSHTEMDKNFNWGLKWIRGRK